MTPLLRKFADLRSLPVRERRIVDEGHILPRLDEVHSFEVTAALDAACGLTETFERTQKFAEKLLFLPAPRTWIEYATSSRGRRGFMLEQPQFPDGDISITLVFEDRRAPGWLGSDRGPGIGGLGTQIILRHDRAEKDQFEVVTVIAALLAMINSPRIIGRRTHTPSGLERRLLKYFKPQGHYPLLAWTEILLQITPPPPAAGEPCEAHLTGQKALHFCRAFLRVRLGQLEYVTSHWRGDPSLGLKQSRYRMAAGRARMTEASNV